MSAIISKLRTEIEQKRAIPFARFMELALYAAGEGYYERLQQIGAQGDFYTSVSAGPLFGELLAFQFASWFSENSNARSPIPEPGAAQFQIIEAGAHDGQLASDILNWFRAYAPELFSKLEYWIIEPSHLRQTWQTERLKEFQNPRWARDFSELSGKKETAYRIIVSNELLDAMPTHRIGWDATAKSWFEWGVAWSGGDFIWKRLAENQRSEICFPAIVPELLDVLFDRFSTEICPAATRWWTNASNLLSRGKIIAVDYGLRAEEFFAPERGKGTLRAFYRQHANSDLLARPGEQDLTAHVNFTNLIVAGEMAGLKTDAFISQARFLTEVASRTWSVPEKFGEWDTRRRKNFQTLTHPEHLGRPFRVLVQSK